MNLINILYQPYVIIILISLIITTSTYVWMKYNKIEEEEYNNNNKISEAKTLLITFISSFTLLMLSYFGVTYASKNNLFEKIRHKGGADNGFENDFLDRITVVSDDVDFDMMDE